MNYLVQEDILARITEKDVCAWMVARLEHLRQRDERVPIYNLELQVLRFAEQYFASFNGHAAGACAVSQNSSEEVFEELREELMLNPGKKADEKRRQAKELLEEAAQLDRLANGTEPREAA